MDLKISTQTKITLAQTETYLIFRNAIPKPSEEDAHLRHILRFYIARALQKQGEQEVYILPQFEYKGKSLRIDVASGSPGKYTMAICEPGSVTEETEDILEILKDAEGVEVILVYSQYGKPGKVLERFKDQIEEKKFHVLTVVPPPFDDVYEYDIWMFETTFRNAFEKG